MKQFYLVFMVLVLFFFEANGQIDTPYSPCSFDEILSRMSENNPNVAAAIAENEAFIQDFITRKKAGLVENVTYIIPVVLHVFHYGDDGKMDLEQVQSGMDILNNDFNGLNDGWDTIDPEFDSIKGTLDIQFCLATIDPEGNPTTGVNYYEDEDALYNNIDLYQYAWDNYKYLNIYLPKYVFGEPSDFTAFASYPNTANSNNNRDGIHYSSIRWGYGNHSELSPGQDWASVNTHEAGHWLDLRHTFHGGCSSLGDGIDDTPPTLGSGIELSGCDNNDFSCGVATNGENFMDYNHDCKKMFTLGQVDRMIAALHLPSRLPLWSDANLVATGCSPDITSVRNIRANHTVKVFPNPASNQLTFEFESIPSQIMIYDGQGKLVITQAVNNQNYRLNTSSLSQGIYFYLATYEDRGISGKFFIR